LLSVFSVLNFKIVTIHLFIYSSFQNCRQLVFCCDAYFLFFLSIQMNVEKLMKMAGSVRTGGKGTVRRYILSIIFFHVIVVFLKYLILLSTIHWCTTSRSILLQFSIASTIPIDSLPLFIHLVNFSFYLAKSLLWGVPNWIL
jgi:hypothetical protein